MQTIVIEKGSKNMKNPFTPQEDEKLTKIVKYFQKRRDINWQYVSQQMETRTARQCKDRWTNYLDTKINHLKFTPEENYFILKKVEEIGRKWKTIAAMMKNRTDVAIKSQFRKLMRRNANVNNVLTICTDSYNMRRKNPTQQTKVEAEIDVKPDIEEFFGSFEYDNANMFDESWV